ncbi:MAG TPA: hypothetical protein PKZ54_04940 [Syntrophorhabdaceae bacterium]|nr:hypothetical protein [Syntrophorhabdaceae bacterium]
MEKSTRWAIIDENNFIDFKKSTMEMGKCGRSAIYENGDIF